MSRYALSLMLLVLLLSGCGWWSDESDQQNPSPAIEGNQPTVAPLSPSATSDSSSAPSPTATIPADASASATVASVETPDPSAPLEPTARLAYFHIAPTDGEPAGVLAEYASFITLTSGDEGYRTQLRAAGYTGTILQFLVAAEVNGPGPYRSSADTCDESFAPLRNGIVRETGTFCRDVHPNEDWFLHNGAGERLYTIVGQTGVWYHMNPGNDGWRNYALSAMLRDVTGATALGYDGIFLDNVEVSPVRVLTMMENSDGVVQELESEQAYQSAWVDYLGLLSAGVREFAQLWGNLVSDTNDGDSWDPYLPHLDGVMSPAFATGYHGLSVGKWLNNIRQAEAAIEQGKGLVAVGLGPRDDEEAQAFAYGSYLLVTDTERAYFRYVSNENSVDFSSFWLYPNYELVLGQPQGERYRVGLNWRRDFQCGYVIVEPAAQAAEITQTSECGSQ